MPTNQEILGRGWHFPFKFSRTGGVERARNLALVRMSITQILGTRLGTRVPIRDFGSALKAQVFAPIQPELGILIQHLVRRSIEVWEHRVLVQYVRTEVYNSPDARIDVDVRFVVIATQEVGNLVWPFLLDAAERSRQGV